MSWVARYRAWRAVRVVGSGCVGAGVVLVSSIWEIAVPLVVFGVGLLVLAYNRRRALKGTNPRSVSESRTVVYGLRAELLAAATRYGLAQALKLGHPGPEWQDWIGYTRAIDAWTIGWHSEEERDERLSRAREVTPDDALQVAREASETDWSEQLIGLAEAAQAEADVNLPIFSEFRKDGSHPPGLWLLGAVEDSLVLDLYGDGPGDDLLCAGPDEVLNLLTAARSSGVWAYTEREPRPVMPAIPGVAPSDEDEADRLATEIQAYGRVSADLYRELDPQGRELSDEERERVHQQLCSAARLMRRVSVRRKLLNDVISSAPQLPRDMDADRVLDVQLRRFQRGFVLMLADDHRLRNRVLPASMIVDDVLANPQL
jgi:hypothetical protein